MVPSISNFDLEGIQYLTLELTMKVKADRLPKLISSVVGIILLSH
jgi:hypothetical protein